MALSAVMTGRPTRTSAPWWERAAGWLAAQRVHRPDLVDAAIVLVCFAGFTVPVLAGVTGGAGSAWAVAGFGAAAVVPLLVRRRWPLAVLAAVVLVEVAASLAGVRFTVFVSNGGPAVGVAVWTVADRYPRRASLLAAAVAVIVTSGAELAALHLHHGQDQDYVQSLAAIPGWLFGDGLRTRRGYRQQLSAEADHRRAEHDQRVRAEERLRLSREVHDIVSHALGMIAVRSGVARMLLDDRPGEAKAALAAIEAASRASLDELRAVLRRLRDDDNAPPAVDEPTLADLDTLADTLRRDGYTVAQQVMGPVHTYAPLVQSSAYRIVREALTNVIKHAAANHVEITLTHTSDQLVVTVADDGHGSVDPPVAGLGLTGMRERAELLGGTLNAGPRAGGGFAVTARLPVHAP